MQVLTVWMQDVGRWLRPCRLIAAVSAILACGFCARCDPTPLRFGSASADITPVEPVDLAGYPPAFQRRTGEIHDRLFCRVTAFQIGARRLVFVNTDLVGYYGIYEFLRDPVCARFGLQADELFFTAIHTHSGPAPTIAEAESASGNYRYTLQLRERVLDTVSAALAQLTPAHLAVARGYCPAGVNRRVQRFQPAEFPADGGLVKLGRNPDGPLDREVLVLRVTTEKGGACVFNYGCHARSLRPGGPEQISGDFIGLAEQWIEQHLSGANIAPALVGASGDIDPVFHESGFDREDGRMPETMLLAMLLGEEVLHLHRDAATLCDPSSLQSVIAQLSLPSRSHGEYTTNPALPPTSLVLTVASIGEIGFVGLGCEALTEIGLAIKRASPFRHTFVITHCNGGSGYLAPASLYKERGYEVSASPFGPEAAEAVVREALRMLHKQYEAR